jgi:GNAT superfamily N-acetyltransferase
MEETIWNLQSMPPFVDVRLWAIWTPNQGQISALANFTVWRTEDNQHMGQCDITVLPEYRRQGLARRLLEQVAAAAREEKRRLLLTNTTDRIPAGESFMLRLGGVRGLIGHSN